MISTSETGPRPGGSEAPAFAERRPLVSVCIPTRDRAGYLREALASVLAEDVPDVEVVVSDDASLDETPRAVADLGDPRIVYRRNPRPLGIAGNRNACVAVARGRYLAWLDDDDAYLPGGLARQIRALEGEPAAAMVHGAIEVVDAAGAALPPWEVPFAEDTVEEGRAAFAELLLSNYVRAPTVVTRADAQRGAGPYAARLGDRAEDWDAWLRLALAGDVAYVARPVARYRHHDGGASADRGSSRGWLVSETRVVYEALRRAREAGGAPRGIEDRASAALTVRHLDAAADSLVRGRRLRAHSIARRAAWLAPTFREPLGRAADRALAGDEHGFHEAAGLVLRRAAERLRGTRFGAELESRLDATDAWAAERADVAGRIRSVVPPGARVATIDKWDPCLLHEAGREGWHFPDLALSPRGYPADDGEAIGHLEAQRSRGVRYLVVPRASFWWLEHYGRFSAHLSRRYDRVWADEVCVIYRLVAAARAVS